jgi:hypothetical protein
MTHDASGGDIISAVTYSVQVSNSKGQVVAEVDATEGQSDPHLPLLKGLFTAARTAGLGGYEVIDNMIQVLQVTP